MTDPRQPHAPVPRPADSQPRRCNSYLTIKELSAATTYSVSTLRRLAKKGIIVGHQPGGARHRVVFSPDAIEQATNAQKSRGAVSDQGDQSSDDTARPQRGPRPKWTRGS